MGLLFLRQPPRGIRFLPQLFTFFLNDLSCFSGLQTEPPERLSSLPQRQCQKTSAAMIANPISCFINLNTVRPPVVHSYLNGSAGFIFAACHAG
jgi:hypothetical protein